MKIILTGYMGSGKTLVGRTLSEKTGLPFFDLDKLISEQEGRTIPEIFQTSGEIYFRKKEAEVLQEHLKSDSDFILALGGGTPCYGNNLSSIKEKQGAKLIYLKTGLEELIKRLSAEKEQRPVIGHLDSSEALEDFIRKHLFERTYYYNQSELIVTTDGKTSEEIAGEILEKLD